ncbi:cyclin-G1 [Perognathus longimembris pacificus]|uniref:cyclin-G1 n=1 Tax=Perognathus longimembris pacificus TaxID=214514 RepID=UPI002019D45E|nr:cyclin-G1 [Perognathus longimembris pacificus]
MIEVPTTPDTQNLLHQLSTLLEQESRCQPKVCGLRLIESAHDNGLRMTARLRDFEVKDLLSLTQFFGFDTETFSLAVNLLDRFLSKMKVQPKHLGCVGLSCFYLAVKSVEEERNVPLATDLIRISQYRFTVSDLMRMEKIVLEKVCWKVRATTAFQFLQLYASLIQENLPSERRNSLNFERLEAQLKACHCRITFSKAKPSVLALSIVALEVQAQKSLELTEGLECLQKHSKISGRDLIFWQELVSKCLTEYSSNKCSKPNIQKLKWIVSGRTARQLKHSYYRISHLPTIPETVS